MVEPEEFTIYVSKNAVKDKWTVHLHNNKDELMWSATNEFLDGMLDDARRFMLGITTPY